MTGNLSPVGQILGASVTGTASGTILANTGNQIFQTIMFGVIIASIALILTRLVKITSK